MPGFLQQSVSSLSVVIIDLSLVSLFCGSLVVTGSERRERLLSPRNELVTESRSREILPGLSEGSGSCRERSSFVNCARIRRRIASATALTKTARVRVRHSVQLILLNEKSCC